MAWKKYRRDGEYSFSFGIYPTLELLKYRPEQVRELLLTADSVRSSAVEVMEGRCQELDIPLTINDKAVRRLAAKENSYVIGVFEKYWPSLDAGNDHLVLVNPADMGNLGTITRTMVGFGFYDLALIRPAVDVFDPRTVRASMGALFQIRFAYFDSFEDYLNSLSRERGERRGGVQPETGAGRVPMVGGRFLYPMMTDGKVELGEVKFKRPLSLVFGSEGMGLAASYHGIGTSVRIAQEAGIDSLNLPVAVGIGLYEMLQKDRGAWFD
jgi:TrmH family RNA methyltransferase